MTCKDFENWMLTSDGSVENQSLIEAKLQAHLAQCNRCATLFSVDQSLESSIKKALEPVDLPDGLMDQVNISIDHALETKKPVHKYSKIRLVASFALIVILGTLFFLNQPFQYKNLQHLSETAVARHLDGDNTMTFHADEIDQALSLMSKELKFNLILPNLTDQGYVLLGGRLCILEKCKIAYLFYEKLDKTCSLFILDYDNLAFKMADGSRFFNDIKGLHTRIWKDNGQVYAMVF